jgi:hypothetical protein
LSCLLSATTTTQSVTPDQNGAIYDVSLPSGYVGVTGSGAVATSYNGSAVDSSNVISASSVFVQSGPHPTDSTKWRFILKNSQNAVTDLTLWVTTLS